MPRVFVLIEDETVQKVEHSPGNFGVVGIIPPDTTDEDWREVAYEVDLMRRAKLQSQ